MRSVSRSLFAAALGFIAGTIVADLTAPGVLTWYNRPGAGEALCNCVAVVQSTAESLVHIQAIAASVGAVLFVLVDAVLQWRGRRAGSARPPAAI